MKKTFCRLMIALLLFTTVAFCFTGCTEETHTVTFISYVPVVSLHKNDKHKKYDIYLTQQVDDGAIIGNIEIDDTLEIYDTETDKSGTYKFSGWFTDKSYGIQWNLMSDTVKGDITLYAKWEAI